MINLDNVIKENVKRHNPNWPEIPDHPYKILIVGDSGSGKQMYYLIQQTMNQIY